MTKTKTAARRNMTIMVTCVGRRVSLLESFRKAAKSLEINVSIIGTDNNELSPAMQLCDKNFLVKPVKHRDYIKQLLSIVKNNQVKLLVPTVDLDLKLLAKNKSLFSKLGCCVLVSSPEVIGICQDKRKAYRFLVKNRFDTPATISIQSALKKRKLSFPCFLKPWDGYASRGNAIVKNRKELQFFSKRVPNCIVQELVEGDEYTCDVFVDFEMNVRCVVPRKRIEIRAGEVSKAKTVKDTHIMSDAKKLVERLGAGPGIITLQLFKDQSGNIKFIEINPRFGGGIPLSIKAGADFPKWILRQLLGLKTDIRFDGFKNNLTMLRYDSEVWIEGNSK